MDDKFKGFVGNDPVTCRDNHEKAADYRTFALAPINVELNVMPQITGVEHDIALQERVCINELPYIYLDQKRHILQAIYPFSPRIDNLADNVESGFAKYNELEFLRDKLKISFTITLTLVLLFSIAASIWAAFFCARFLTLPISELSHATSAIADGNYDTSVTAKGDDDLASLARSFNYMTRKIAFCPKIKMRVFFKSFC